MWHTAATQRLELLSLAMHFAAVHGNLRQPQISFFFLVSELGVGLSEVAPAFAIDLTNWKIRCRPRAAKRPAAREHVLFKNALQHWER